MKKSILFLIFCSSLFGQSINYAVSDKHSFVLPKGKLELKSAYLKMNDTLDILNIKDSVVGTSTTLRTSGDMDGYDLELRYGLTKKDTIIINYQSWDIDYSEAILQNRRLELINRYNIYTNNYSFFNSLSIDIGYKRDSSDSLDFKKDNSINSLIKKIKPNSDIYLEDGDIHYGDSTFTIYDNVGNKIYPYISIENLSSTSYMARLLLSKKISYHSLFDIYVAYRDIKITTGINIYPKVSMIDNILNGHDMPILDRDEKNLDIGFSYTIESDKYIYEIDYQYTKIFRDSETSYIDYNHVLDASISKKVTKSLLLYIGGRLMLEQFNTDIPYLYNKYTKASFDKKYGFAKFGMVYSFRGI